VKCKDGIIFGTEKIVLSKMMVSGTDKRINSINVHIGCVVNGLVPDGKCLSLRGREESEQYTTMFKIRIPVPILVERVALRAQMSTIYGSYRPFGTSLIIGGWDSLRNDYCLFMVEPSGQSFEYYGCASGRGKQLARNEIEKKNFREMTV
jgi:20S proteasome subunit alpha 7